MTYLNQRQNGNKELQKQKNPRQKQTNKWIKLDCLIIKSFFIRINWCQRFVITIRWGFDTGSKHFIEIVTELKVIITKL